MPVKPYAWKDLPSETTPLDTVELNKAEAAIGKWAEESLETLLYTTGKAVATTTGTLSTGAPITSIAISPLNAAILPVNAEFKVKGGGHEQQWKLTTRVEPGATTLKVTSQEPNFAYAAGAEILPLATEVKNCKSYPTDMFGNLGIAAPLAFLRGGVEPEGAEVNIAIGGKNPWIGYTGRGSAMQNLEDGYANIAVGFGALATAKNKVNRNTVVGFLSAAELGDNASGNTVYGSEALHRALGTNVLFNTAVGLSALKNTQNSGNTAVGCSALQGATFHNAFGFQGAIEFMVGKAGGEKMTGVGLAAGWSCEADGTVIVGAEAFQYPAELSVAATATIGSTVYNTPNLTLPTNAATYEWRVKSSMIEFGEANLTLIENNGGAGCKITVANKATAASGTLTIFARYTGLNNTGVGFQAFPIKTGTYDVASNTTIGAKSSGFLGAAGSENLVGGFEAANGVATNMGSVASSKNVILGAKSGKKLTGIGNIFLGWAGYGANTSKTMSYRFVAGYNAEEHYWMQGGMGTEQADAGWKSKPGEETASLEKEKHRFANGDAVKLTSITGGGGTPTTGVIYYIVERSENFVKLATEPGGTAITFGSEVTAATFNNVQTFSIFDNVLPTARFGKITTPTAEGSATDKVAREAIGKILEALRGYGWVTP